MVVAPAKVPALSQLIGRSRGFRRHLLWILVRTRVSKKGQCVLCGVGQMRPLIMFIRVFRSYNILKKKKRMEASQKQAEIFSSSTSLIWNKGTVFHPLSRIVALKKVTDIVSRSIHTYMYLWNSASLSYLQAKLLIVMDISTAWPMESLRISWAHKTWIGKYILSPAEPTSNTDKNNISFWVRANGHIKRQLMSKVTLQSCVALVDVKARQMRTPDISTSMFANPNFMTF